MYHNEVTFFSFLQYNHYSKNNYAPHDVYNILITVTCALLEVDSNNQIASEQSMR